MANERDEDQATAMLRPVDGDAGAPTAKVARVETGATQRITPNIWAARVPVRPDDAVPVREPAAEEGWFEEDEDRADRAWVRPLVITLIVLVLLAMLGTGLWLIFHRKGDATTPVPGLSAAPATSPTATATATATAAPSETAPSEEQPSPTEAPTTTQPATQTPASTPTVAAQVPVPPVVGQTVTAAERQLVAQGLSYTVSRRVMAHVRAGMVVATDPRAGSMVDPGYRVTLVVAQAAPTPSPSATNASPAR